MSDNDLDSSAGVKAINVTIIFWDIRGFSKLAKNLESNPKLLLDFLRDYFRTASQIIVNPNGFLDKFIGDGIMAIFGLNHNKDVSVGANNAAGAAPEFNKKFRDLKEKWVANLKKYVLDFEGKELGLKCGINTGIAICGNIGMSNSFTALGNTVNVANRFCDYIGEAGHIYISSTTKTNLDSTFKLTYVANKNIPNIGKHDVFEVISEFDNKPGEQSETGNGQITNWTLPKKIAINEPTAIYVAFFGSVNLGYLSLRIRDSSDKDYWFADPRSISPMQDKGILSFRNQVYTNNWSFIPDSKIKPGEGVAEIDMYEVKDEKGNDGTNIRLRPQIASKHQKIILYKDINANVN
ncbi:MAG TPA: adenylate/guanylate cyclase domain-containing protein [Nitrososphaeraceae archaeon]|nr:adenylate/guanylate cyclase domain-containing protein [Nitrososphaeraceae archaeon]